MEQKLDFPGLRNLPSLHVCGGLSISLNRGVQIHTNSQDASETTTSATEVWV